MCIPYLDTPTRKLGGAQSTRTTGGKISPKPFRRPLFFLLFPSSRSPTTARSSPSRRSLGRIRSSAAFSRVRGLRSRLRPLPGDRLVAGGPVPGSRVSPPRASLSPRSRVSRSGTRTPAALVDVCGWVE
jgi:hypothetical protein